MKKLFPKVGVGVITRKGKKILLLKRIGAHDANTWCPPGGHLEWGESPERCAKREVKEETGCQIKNIRLLAVTNDKFKKDKKHYVTLVMTADYKSGQEKVCEKDKANDIKWFNYNKLPKPLFVSLFNLVNNNSYPKNVWKKLWLKK
ncbi:MAG: NUDIX domain-containing protein [Candidatus Nealsonbacteria bacterium]|nr:NUDIX domain-containing protein [Candidatus Nealsonbacteria bacterium]